jgi:hypothetical protein
VGLVTIEAIQRRIQELELADPAAAQRFREIVEEAGRRATSTPFSVGEWVTVLDAVWDRADREALAQVISDGAIVSGAGHPDQEWPPVTLASTAAAILRVTGMLGRA